MTVSNAHIFTLNQSQIITEAAELTGMVDIASPIEPAIFASCLRSLNIYIKAWQSKGLFLHTYKSATLFLSTGQQSYLLGPTGDHATESYIETTLSADAASGAGSVSLTSTDGMTTGDNIGIMLDDGTLFWTTITLPGTLAANITADAASGNAVYTYTNKIIRPLKVISLDCLSGGVEIPINPISISEYDGLTNKDSASSPVQYAFDPQLDNCRLYVWPVADSDTQKITFRHQKPVDDFTDNSVTASIPANWLQCLVLGLAYNIAPKLSTPLDRQAALKKRYDDALMDLDDFEESSVYFQPRSR